MMPLGADLLSKFRKDKTKEEGIAQRPVADVRIVMLTFVYREASFFNTYLVCMGCALLF